MSTELRKVEHISRRLLIPLPMLYDEAIHTYEQLVPVIDRARFGQLATWDAVLALAEINAPLGFMIYSRDGCYCADGRIAVRMEVHRIPDGKPHHCGAHVAS